MRCTNSECGDNTIIGELTESGTVARKCSKCGAHWKPAIVEQPVSRVAASNKSAQRQVVKQTATAAKFDVIRAARARLKELNVEIARLEKLTSERDQLARLLAAAKTPTGAKTVTPLRRCAT